MGQGMQEHVAHRGVGIVRLQSADRPPALMCTEKRVFHRSTTLLLTQVWIASSDICKKIPSPRTSHVGTHRGGRGLTARVGRGYSSISVASPGDSIRVKPMSDRTSRSRSANTTREDVPILCRWFHDAQLKIPAIEVRVRVRKHLPFGFAQIR